MKIKHHEIIPNEKSPFAECKLAREPYARVLTDIVSTYADGFVLAINNEWGTGKTTFIKMWQQQLKSEGFQTVYFNAWENDFDNNPLVAMMAELETLTNAKNKKVFKSVVEKGAILVKNIAPALAKSLIKKHFGNIDDSLVDAIENTTKASTEILEEEIKKYSSKKKTIVEFREELEKFAKLTGNLKPLVIFVDELDRCRPSYSVEVLEQIKHLFSVSGIVFVLSIDKTQLACSIKGYYGSEHINSDEYLRRFIDLEYSIPKSSTILFVDYLIEYFSFRDFFASSKRILHSKFENDLIEFTNFSKFLLNKMNVSLRQQEKLFALNRLVLCTFKPYEYTFPSILFLLIYLKNYNLNLYHKIERNELTLQELSTNFTSLIEIKNSSKHNLNFGFIEALLLWFYNNNNEIKSTSDLYYKSKEINSIDSPINSALTDSNLLARYFEDINRREYDDYKISDLIKKINLLDQLSIEIK